jgi:hypothetical protein
MAADSADRDDRVDDDRDVERRRSLSRSGPRVPPGVAPELHDQVTEAIDDCGVLTKARLAVNIANGADPFRHPIEFCELSLERREYRKSSQTRSSVRLVDIEVAPDEPLDEWRRPVERPMAGDVGKTVVNLDELKVAGRNEWGGERQSEFVQATLDQAMARSLTRSKGQNRTTSGRRRDAKPLRHGPAKRSFAPVEPSAST